MAKKIFLICAIFLLLIGFVQALEFEMDKLTILKGENFLIEGKADSIVSITATSGNKTVFSTRVPVAGGAFSFERKTSFLDPAGDWIIKVSDSASSQESKVRIKPSRKSRFLLISFLSPPPIKFSRTSTINVAVKITDSGKPVKDAVVFFWAIDGKRIALTNTGNGVYSVDYQLPVNVKTGEFDLTVVAKAFEENSGEIGGENSIKLEIEPSPISIEVLKPKSKGYVVGEPLEMEFGVSYADNSPVENVRLSGAVNFDAINFLEKGNGIYFATFFPREVNNDVFNVSISVLDEFENAGEKHFSLKPQGFLQWAFKENAILYVFPLILLLYILLLSLKELNFFYRLNNAKRKKHALLGVKKRLHENFYKKSVISEKSFNKENFKLNTKLDRIELDLKKLSKSEK